MNGHTDAFGYINKNIPTHKDEQPVEQTNSTASPTANLPELRFGSIGISVSILQSILIYMGYKGVNGFDLDIDGGYGTHTVHAVQDFQKAVGITADGVCGKNTWKKLKEGLIV